MTDAELLDGIREVIRENLPNANAEIAPETRFPSLVGWDSVTHVTMMLDMEDRFGVTIEESRVFDIADVKTLIATIRAQKV